MATSADCDGQWYSELDVVARTGLPGPLVAALLPQLPTPLGDYSAHAALYHTDSIARAHLVVLMLKVGIRLRFIRMAITQPMSADHLAEGIAEWTTLANELGSSGTSPNGIRRLP